MDHTGVFGRSDVAVLTAAEAARVDSRARTAAGVPERVLMENAGRSAALILQRLHPRGRIVGFAGSGNNGGDLLVALRNLRQWGRECALVHAGSRAPDTSLLHGIEIPIVAAQDAARFDVVIDGVLGTGTAGAPRDAALQAIEAINASARPVLALDIPSGVDGTTGQVTGAAVRAHTTITFGWPKLGIMLHPGRGHAGRVIAIEIAFPPLHEDEFAAELITPGWTRARLPRREPNAHKGTSGRLLVAAGQSGMAGAAGIAAQAAVRAGTGLVRVASDRANREILQSLVPEATFLDRDALAPVSLQGLDALVVGPGFGTDSGALAALRAVLDGTPSVPALLDADALNLAALSDVISLPSLARSRPLVITPHPRELARLLDCAVDDIVADAPAAAREAVAQFGCVVLLKGQPSLVAAPGQPLLINTAGSSDVAVGGMGDQLSGVIGAMLAAGLEPRTAAAVGLYLSSRAADRAGRGRALSPRDVSEGMTAVLLDPGSEVSPLDLPFITFDQAPRR